MKPAHSLIVGAVAAAAGVAFLLPPAGHDATLPDLAVYDGCPAGGDRAAEAPANQQKNRFDSPPSPPGLGLMVSDLQTKVAGAFVPGTGATLTGYVSYVKPGGSESCNCLSASDIDTHIYVSADALHTAKRDAIIVEVTPRTRAENPAWSQDWLKTQLTGHTVRFTGWLFDDLEHRASSAADRGHSLIWRSSCWEIHPVTKIEVLR